MLQLACTYVTQQTRHHGTPAFGNPANPEHEMHVLHGHGTRSERNWSCYTREASVIRACGNLGARHRIRGGAGANPLKSVQSGVRITTGERKRNGPRLGAWSKCCAGVREEYARRGRDCDYVFSPFKRLLRYTKYARGTKSQTRHGFRVRKALRGGGGKSDRVFSLRQEARSGMQY